MFPYRIVFEVKSVNKGLFLVKMAGSIGNLWPTKIYQVVLRFSLSFYSEDSRRPSNVQSTFVLIEIASTSIRQMSTWDRTHVKSYESQTSSVYGSHWFSVRALYFFLSLQTWSCPIKNRRARVVPRKDPRDDSSGMRHQN